MAQLKSLLTYEAPGWLVDATVLTLSSATNASSDEALLDVTGMFQRDVDGPHVGGKDEDEEEDEEVGIAGLGDSPHARKLQLTVLRETCLREIVFMLVEVYKTTGRHADCVRLADLVADNEFGIYKVSELFFFIVLFCTSAACSAVIRSEITTPGTPHRWPTGENIVLNSGPLMGDFGVLHLAQRYSEDG